MRFILQLFTWWNGQTLGTRLMTWRKGVKVGEDAVGNIYYETKDKKRRWVIFAGDSEASRVPAEWHGWLHHSYDNRPGLNELGRQSWELPHKENMTGGVNAYAPDGSQYSSSEKKNNYHAWTPNS